MNRIEGEETDEPTDGIRKAIKPMGYKLSIQSQSWGPHATYVHAESGQRLNFNVFTPDTLTRWKPLIDWLKANAKDLEQIRESEDIRGLKGC